MCQGKNTHDTVEGMHITDILLQEHNTSVSWTEHSHGNRLRKGLFLFVTREVLGRVPARANVFIFPGWGPVKCMRAWEKNTLKTENSFTGVFENTYYLRRIIIVIMLSNVIKAVSDRHVSKTQMVFSLHMKHHHLLFAHTVASGDRARRVILLPSLSLLGRTWKWI